MGQIETFSFDKGINRKKAKLFLEPGEIYSCSGFSYLNDGVLTARKAKTVGEVIDATTTSRVNGLHRFDEDIHASVKALCPGEQAYFNYIYHRTTSGSYSYINFLNNNTRPRFFDYQKFTFLTDTYTKKAYIGGNAYEWGFPSPEKAPVLALGIGGNPDAEYYCYYTYYVEFPNGKVVESGPSPSATITATADKIEWSNITPCPYTGTGITLTRRLYRTVSGVAYLVDIIADNTTTTYSDNVTDTALQSADIMESEEYTTPPSNIKDAVIYLQRVFCIVDNKIYWSEPYMPFSFLDTSDITVSKEDENLVCLADWGDQLYIASVERWYRLQGSDPDTWAIKRTFSDNGVNNVHTVKRTKWGILGQWYDGIYAFEGTIARNITEKKLGTKFFTDMTDQTVSYAEFDGTRYYYYYASTGSTVDSCVVIDFTHGQEYRIYEDDFEAHAHHYYKGSGTHYYGKSGYEYGDGGTETIATSLVTGDKAFQAITKRKCLDYLYYDVDTNGKDLTVNITADGATVDSLTINTSTRERKRSRKLKNKEGYYFGLEMSCTDSQYMDIYSPWILEATPVGE